MKVLNFYSKGDYYKSKAEVDQAAQNFTPVLTYKPAEEDSHRKADRSFQEFDSRDEFGRQPEEHAEGESARLPADEFCHRETGGDPCVHRVASF
jgi:hypothetical protein